MTAKIQEHDAGERRSLALLLLITFGILTLIFVWLLYSQVAQVLTREGRCTVLSAQLTPANINNGAGQTDGTVYYVNFTVDLTTADGQHLRVPGYYGSSNHNFGDQASAENVLHQYAVGSSANCSYTYLDASGTQVLFSPIVPVEGFFFVSALLLIFLVLSVICFRALRHPRAVLPPELAEQDQAEYVDSQEV
ncbi:MAG TPA: hypothetical protein VFN35_15450 [Ktedonobacteraceae bacterium]|nr:hypothetical protein [Ktedonobacteraceae bacterium]